MVGNNVGNRKIRVLFAKGSRKILVIVNLSNEMLGRIFFFPFPCRIFFLKKCLVYIYGIFLYLVEFYWYTNANAAF